jgi:hypothetical protein
VVKHSGNETRTWDDTQKIEKAAQMTSSIPLTGYTVSRNINLERRERLKVHNKDEEYIGRNGNT